MTQMPYKRQQGDFEIRILSDGRLVMIAPDETLIEIAQIIETNTDSQQRVESGNAECPGTASP
jgi:hypothetical protein